MDILNENKLQKVYADERHTWLFRSIDILESFKEIKTFSKYYMSRIPSESSSGILWIHNRFL